MNEMIEALKETAESLTALIAARRTEVDVGLLQSTLMEIARRAEETQIHQEDAKARLIDPNLAREAKLQPMNSVTLKQFQEANAAQFRKNSQRIASNENRLRTLLCDALVIIDAHRRHTGGEGDLVAHEIRQMGVDYGPNQPNREKNAITQLSDELANLQEELKRMRSFGEAADKEIDRLTNENKRLQDIMQQER